MFSLANGRQIQHDFASPDRLAELAPLWVDLEAPSPEEEGWILGRFGLHSPDIGDDEDLEESARFDEGGHDELPIRSDFLIEGGGGQGATPADNVRVAFMLYGPVLFSVQAQEPPVFRLLRLRARRIPARIEDDKDVLLKLFDADADADAEVSADALDGIYDPLELVSACVLKLDVGDRAAGEALSAIAREEDLNGRIRRKVMDTRRAVSFLMRSRLLNAEQFEEARQIMRDIDSLDSSAAVPFDKVDFLMDATVGFININQNRIIKIFSVASVALLPPRLIASVYGMNSQRMPELQRRHGHVFALSLMACSVLALRVCFRRKGWLR